MQEDQREIFCKSSVQMKKAGGFEIYQRDKRYWVYKTAQCGAGRFESANIATGEAKPELSPASSCFPLLSGILKGEVIPGKHVHVEIERHAWKPWPAWGMWPLILINSY